MFILGTHNVKRAFKIASKNTLLAIALVAGLASCKTQQIGQSVENSAQQKEIKLKQISTQKLLRMVEENQLNYRTLESKKVSVKFKTPEKNQSLKAMFRLRKDSMLLLLANKGVIMIGKMKLTPENVDLLYHIDRKHFYGSLEDLREKYQVDLSFELVQAFFSGDLVSYRDDPKKREFRKFHVTQENGQYLLVSLRDRKFRKVIDDDQKMQRFFERYDEEKLILQKIYINPETFLTSRIELQDIKEEIVTNLYYKNYIEHEGKFLPIEMVITASKGGVQTLAIDIKMSRVEVNSNPRFNFSVPSKYESKPIK